MSPEYAHEIVCWLIKVLHKIPGVRQFFNFFYTTHHLKLKRNICGLTFENPIGLAAGFDKNAQLFNEFSSFGFGFIEVGTVTPLPQEGNPKPRLFRLKEDHAIINRMGFNNDGVDVVVNRLKKKYSNIIIGGNIGKNKITPNSSAVDDYLMCFDKIAPYVDYLVLNISSPNTPNLVELQDKLYLTTLLEKIQQLNRQSYNKPVFIKISPDLTFSQIDEVLVLIDQFKVSGIIATNTSSKRINLKTPKYNIKKIGSGGLSGKPLFKRSLEVVAYIHKKNQSLPIVAVGGISNVDDAMKMFDAGASLIQLYTAFIYSGPSIVKNINNKLLRA